MNPRSSERSDTRSMYTMRAKRTDPLVWTSKSCASTGKDAFFKAHKDTPRSKAMFGSLVIIFPTKHEGGELILRDKGQEWTFDSAAAVNSDGKPRVAYVAFYSDVEHEVGVVSAGHRVTLT